MKDFFGHIQDYQKGILGALVLVVAVGGGTYYYRHYRLQREEQAHKALSETLHEFNKAMRDQTTWDEVGLAALTGYRQHKSSSLAPYFLSIQADTALYKGDFEEAKKIMDTVLHDLPASSPFYYPFKIKYARMLIDSTDEQTSLHGLKELEKLTQDTHNIMQDSALYYLGNYYADRNEMVRAHEIWQNLIQRFSTKKQEQVSPWVELAQSRLR